MATIRIILLTIVCGSWGMILPAFARPLVPLTTSNQNPLVAIYGLPVTAPGTLVSSAQTELELRVDVASLCSSSQHGETNINLDGETYRYALAVKRGLGRDFEIGLEIPYIQHSEGFLDEFIREWHNTFHLPQGERDDVADDQLNYSYHANDSDLLLSDQESGMGDVRLTAAFRLMGETGAKHHLALRGSLKLPTGDEEKLLGSGSTDLAVWLSSSHFYRQETIALFASGGMLLMTDSDVLPDQQRNIVGFGSLGLAWQAFSAVAFKTQLDGHSAFYDSSFTELGESVQLVLGGSIDLSAKTTLDLGVSEDIIVDSAPDVVFHLALHWKY